MNIHLFRTPLAAVIILAVAACAAGTSSNSTLPSASAARRAANGTLSGKGKAVKATLRITIPKRKKARRGPKYIGPQTQSIAVSIKPYGKGKAKKYNADLTPANPNCKGSPLVCTLTFPLEAGGYDAKFATYDGPLAGGNAPTHRPTGHRLSANQNVPFTVESGRANAIDVVLGGIPQSVALVPSAGSSIGGDMASGFSVTRCFVSATLSVIGVDADGNDILGDGAPLPALRSSDPNVVVASPAPSAPNEFTLTASTAPTGPITLTGAVTPLARSGGKKRTGQAALTATFAICGKITEYALPSSPSNEPEYMAVGADSAMWFTTPSGASIGIGSITTAGTATMYPFATPPPRTKTFPLGITNGPDGALWFTEETGNAIGQVTTAGTITERTIPYGGSNPWDIVTGPDHALWITAFGGTGGIIRLTTAGAFSFYSIPTSNSAPKGITVGPDDALWFTEAGGNKIGRMTTDGTVTAEYPIPTSGANPVDITPGPDGALWFTEANANQIGRITTAGQVTEYSVPTAGSEPQNIIAAPDGTLWFTEQMKNLGRITTDGAITEYSTPTYNSGPVGIVVGPDGALWFSESHVNKIGTVQ